MYIVKATRTDAEVVGYVHSTAWKQTYTDIFPAEYLKQDTPQKRADEFLSSFDVGNEYFILYEEDTAVGIIKMLKETDDTCEMSAIYILDEYRNKGYGRQALVYLNEILKPKKLYLWVLKDNEKARRFYEKNGFDFTGKIREINRGKDFAQYQYLKE